MNIGIDIGGSHIAAGLVSENNEIILKKEHIWSNQEKENIFESVQIYCKKLTNEIWQENKDIEIQKIGIGFPAANIINGVINKYGKSIDLPSILSQEFNVPVYLKNDVKCSAICEKKIGNLKEYDNCLFMTLGTGVGGAYFYKDELVTPNIFQGFEIGHMIIEKDGRECNCGNKGCFEQYASMRVFRKDVEELFGIQRITSDILFELVNKKEKIEDINKIIDKYLTYLSIGITNLINIFEADAICIGGSFSYYQSLFIDKLKDKIKINFKDRSIPEILIAKFENDAGMIGASMLESN